MPDLQSRLDPPGNDGSQESESSTPGDGAAGTKPSDGAENGEDTRGWEVLDQGRTRAGPCRPLSTHASSEDTGRKSLFPPLLGGWGFSKPQLHSSEVSELLLGELRGWFNQAKAAELQGWVLAGKGI